jgi:hypothetical protein
MMMIGMLFLWPVFMLFFLGLPVALAIGGYLLYRKAAPPTGRLLPVPSTGTERGYARACPSCGRFLQEEWISCPYCGAECSPVTR